MLMETNEPAHVQRLARLSVRPVATTLMEEELHRVLQVLCRKALGARPSVGPRAGRTAGRKKVAGCPRGVSSWPVQAQEVTGGHPTFS